MKTETQFCHKGCKETESSRRRKCPNSFNIHDNEELAGLPYGLGFSCFFQYPKVLRLTFHDEKKEAKAIVETSAMLDR